VLFVFQRVQKIWLFERDIQGFDASAHINQARIKLEKAINDKECAE